MKKRLMATIMVRATVAASDIAAAACTETGFFRDSINLKAALINPPGTVSGTVNTSGGHSGVYYGAGGEGRRASRCPGTRERSSPW